METLKALSAKSPCNCRWPRRSSQIEFCVPCFVNEVRSTIQQLTINNTHSSLILHHSNLKMSTTTFAEEQFDSSVGYFEGEPGKVLQDGKWTIIRKLGWGPRSSTWLAVDSKDPENIEAIKLFTVAASRESFANNECNVLQGPLKDHFQSFPSLRSTFYEESPKGRHLALVLHVLGPSLESFRVKTGGALPLSTVKKIVADVLESLAILQGKKIVHGGGR